MEWDFIRQLEHYQPETEQEEADRTAMLQAAKQFRKKLLYRENRTAHITSSGFVVNPECSKVLLVYHSLRKAGHGPAVMQMEKKFTSGCGTGSQGRNGRQKTYSVVTGNCLAGYFSCGEVFKKRRTGKPAFAFFCFVLFCVR